MEKTGKIKFPKLGAHVSTAGGLVNATENALKIGAECVQIFGSPPQSWRTRFPAAKEVAAFKAAVKNKKIGPVYLHASYLVNVASPNELVRFQSIASLAEHFKIANQLGAKGLIFHLGSALDAPREEAIAGVIAGAKEVLKKVKGPARLILENSSGGGGKIGVDLEELGKIFRGIGSKRAGVCVDTAHLFQAGQIREYSAEAIKKFLADFEKEIGLKNLPVLHVNDSKTSFDSRHDRHENLGEGYIGLAGFQNLAREEKLRDKDWILEVPGFGGEGPDKENLDILKSCFGQK